MNESPGFLKSNLSLLWKDREHLICSWAADGAKTAFRDMWSLTDVQDG